MADEGVFRVAPLRQEWMTRDQMLDLLMHWASSPDTGAPSITISKRAEELEER